MKLLIILLFVSFETIGQTYNYDVVASTHVTQATKEYILDSLEADCGYFHVSDTIIVNYKQGTFPLRFAISRKTLDLDCKCFYYFTEMNDVIVVNEPMNYIITAIVTPNIVYMKIFYIKSTKDN